MARSTRISVEVTKADIDRAMKKNSSHCVVAQAIARTVPDATRIDVDTQTIRFTREGERLIYLTPYAVTGYVIGFDAGDKIEPFKFQLREPRRSKRRVLTAAGRTAKNKTQRKQRARAKGAAVEVSRHTGPEQEPLKPQDSPKAGYAAATKQVSDKGGRVSPPRVFKRKTRSYGHRELRINQA